MPPSPFSSAPLCGGRGERLAYGHGGRRRRPHSTAHPILSVRRAHCVRFFFWFFFGVLCHTRTAHNSELEGQHACIAEVDEIEAGPLADPSEFTTPDDDCAEPHTEGSGAVVQPYALQRGRKPAGKAAVAAAKFPWVNSKGGNAELMVLGLAEHAEMLTVGEDAEHGNAQYPWVKRTWRKGRTIARDINATHRYEPFEPFFFLFCGAFFLVLGRGVLYIT